ncbi:hypothetical protein [Sporisorium scitamineum]|uniref:Carboxyphosphonoenolpyruvate phosphonomutase n=1 Tax=Sporisorium scitamineum TaxID=49012 RepID=A0A0F7S8C2_9BASI|nr:hypothetical protein [Sporisorium scitamineum]
MTSTSTTTSTARTPAARRRSLLAAPSIVVAPGVFDGISACMALKAGHKAPYQTGAGTSASHLARADLGFLGMSDMIGAAGVSIMADPSMLTTVIADADTGFGGAPQVIVSRFEFLSRITSAVHARDSLPCSPTDRILIIARTDALAVEGLDEAIERLRLAHSAGAGMGFLEGMRSNAEVQTAMAKLPDLPMLANCVTGGKSPLWTAGQAEELGFKLAIFPRAGIFPAAKALLASYAHLADAGIGIEAETQSGKREVDLGGADPMGLRDFFADMGLEHEVRIDRLAASEAGLGDVGRENGFQRSVTTATGTR